MAIITGATKKLKVPEEEGAFVTIRMLSYLELEEARGKRLEAVVRQAGLIGELRDAVAGVDLSSMRPAVAEAAAAKDPLAEYDRATVLRYGLKAWTYDGEVNSDLLDERTATWAAGEIVAYSVPTAAELGKASPASTAT